MWVAEDREERVRDGVALQTRASVPKMKVSSRSGVKPAPGRSQIPEPRSRRNIRARPTVLLLTGPPPSLTAPPSPCSAAVMHAKRGRRPPGARFDCDIAVLDLCLHTSSVAHAGRCRYAALLLRIDHIHLHRLPRTPTARLLCNGTSAATSTSTATRARRPSCSPVATRTVRY
jgi:hypothetical protein